MRSRSFVCCLRLCSCSRGRLPDVKEFHPDRTDGRRAYPRREHHRRPAMLEPAQGFKFKESEQPIRLVIQNATTNGVRPLTYTFEVAADCGIRLEGLQPIERRAGRRGQDHVSDRSAGNRPRLLLARVGGGRRQHRRDVPPRASRSIRSRP